MRAEIESVVWAKLELMDNPIAGPKDFATENERRSTWVRVQSSRYRHVCH